MNSEDGKDNLPFLDKFYHNKDSCFCLTQDAPQTYADILLECSEHKKVGLNHFNQHILKLPIWTRKEYVGHDQYEKE